MDKATKHRRLMTLLSKAGVDTQTRHDLVSGWTQGRTESTSKLFEHELEDLYWKVKNDPFFASNIKRSANAILENALRQKRATVLAIAQRCDIHSGTSFERFNGWMEARSIHKKRLPKYTLDELDELIKQLHAVEANFKKSAEKAGTKAWHKHYGIPESSDN